MRTEFLSKSFRILAWSLVLSPLLGHASAPFGTLTFIEPTGTALDTDTIDVWVRLTLDANSEPLSIANGQPQWNFSLSDFSNGSRDVYLSITSVYTGMYYTCDSSFTGNGCPNTPGSAYSFQFNFASTDNFWGLNNINLSPGESYDYRFGSFTPVGGQAPVGTYTFYNSGAFIGAFGSGYRALHNPDGSFVTDANGDIVYQQAVDEQGNPLFDAVQNPVYVVLLDADGNPVLDALGKPVYEQAIDPDTGELLFDANGNPIYVQATDPDTGELLYTTEKKPKLAVVDNLFSASFDLASNGCSSYDAPGTCTVFTREVIASNVPEASALSLALTGLAWFATGLLARRRCT
jgi:hypothetical protein